MGNHRVKRCEKTIDVSEDVREFVEEIIMGDSSGDEKIDPEDMDPDERLGMDLKPHCIEWLVADRSIHPWL